VPHFGAPPLVYGDPIANEKTYVTPAAADIRHNRIQRWTPPAVAVLCVLAAVGAFVSYGPTHRNALELFWYPILSSRDPVTVCVGNPLRENESSDSEADPTAPNRHFLGSNRISFASAISLARLTGLLQSHEKQYRLMLRSATKFSDLQQGPSVLIGGFNNGWTLRLAATLRFGFERRPGQHPRIRDRQNPARNDWSVDFSAPYRQITRDYAIVSRVQDPNTEQTTVIVAGIAHWGTLAAGEFVTDPTQIQKLRASAPKRWEHMNMQVVLATDVIDGVSGPPKIVATQFW
jgi:hypothetical protein